MGDVNVVREPWVDTFTGETWQVGTKVPRLEINLPKPGVYTLDGLQALAYVRARKGIPGGDVDRGRREQRLVRAMLQKAKQVGSFTKLTELYTKLKSDVETDMTLEQILRFAGLADKLGDAVVRSRYLVGYDSNGAALPDAPEPGISRQEYLKRALTVAVNSRANEGIPVVVLNGTNDAGYIAAVTDRLKEVGFVVTEVRPADKPYPNTIVLDHRVNTKGTSKFDNGFFQSTFDIKQGNVIKQPTENPNGPKFTITVGADFNTCYFSKSLQGSGSEAIEATANPEETKIEQILPSTIVVTTAQEITQPIQAPAVAMTATELLSNTASSRLAPVLSSDAFTPTMSVQRGDLVNVRSGPGIRFRTLGRLVGGQEAPILGRSYDGDWLNIKLPNSERLGWVKAEVVKVVDEPPPATATPVVAADAQATPEPITVIDPAVAPTETALPLPPLPTETPAPRPTTTASNARVVVPRGDIVNLRSGPGTKFRVVGRMFARQSASIIGRTSDGSWWQVRTGGGAAWVAAGIVRVSGDTARIPVIR
jgi:uncharacterized protein YraI